MSKGTLYIAGPISNTTDFHERFAAGCMEVAQLGYVPLSPLEVTKAVGITDNGGPEVWLLCMKADIRALLTCDGIYCLRGWENSRGARIEQFIANALDMLVLYQREDFT